MARIRVKRVSTMKDAALDIYRSLIAWRLWTTMGWLALRQRYKRSIIGPFSITLSMGVLIFALGVIYGELFKMDVQQYLPMLAVGLVFWAFISSVINEGCNAFIGSASYITQLPTPKFVFILQLLWRNLMMLCHNLAIVFFVAWYFDTASLAGILQAFLGFLLLAVNLIWLATLCALTTLRFRDFSQMVASIMQVLFYITPILFAKSMLERYSALLMFNPLAWFIDMVRSPLIAQTVEPSSYLFSGILACAGLLLTFLLFVRVKDRIPYWV